MKVQCRNCGSTVGHGSEVPTPEHCGDCPPWRCDQCGQMDSTAKRCRCWTPIGDMNTPEIRALFAGIQLDTKVVIK